VVLAWLATCLGSRGFARRGAPLQSRHRIPRRLLASAADAPSTTTGSGGIATGQRTRVRRSARGEPASSGGVDTSSGLDEEAAAGLLCGHGAAEQVEGTVGVAVLFMEGGEFGIGLD